MKRFRSIDAVLTKYGKLIKEGETITFNLIKGENTSSRDPLDAKAPVASFPIVAKFGHDNPKLETVAHRMYEQKIPVALDDSDEENQNAGEELKGLGATGGLDGGQAWAARGKRRRRNRPDRWQWILEPEDEFMESLGIKTKSSAHSASVESNNHNEDMRSQKKLRYEGVAEANSSSYYLFEIHPSSVAPPPPPSTTTSNFDGTQPQLSIRATEVKALQMFQRPNKVKSLSMQQAEDSVMDERAKMTRLMMHGKAAAAGQPAPGGSLLRSNKPVPLSRARLLTKVWSKEGNANAMEEDDEDDVMTDIRFSKRKKGARARQELLETLGDGLVVDDDGVLGGANDSEFAGKRSFGKVAQQGNSGPSTTATTKTSSSTYDGMAMADDFYQRDVQAEYEELDFDANEQFDDDEVDRAEEMDASGVVGDDEGEESESDEEEEGVAGLATLAGLKALMAKARGEATPEETAAAVAASSVAKRIALREEGGGNVTSDQSTDEELPRIKRQRVGQQPQAQPAVTAPPPPVPVAASSKVSTVSVDPLAMDETGQRIISLEAIRREIWLHHGQIKVKTLVKIFNVKKRSPEHKKIFGDLVKELCTMSQTVEGNVLVLKQHYAK